MESNKLQNIDFYLPGDLGSVNVGGSEQKITQVFKAKDGSTTITVDPDTQEHKKMIAEMDSKIKKITKILNDGKQ